MPWCSHWWNACWPGVPTPPQTTGQVSKSTASAFDVHALAVGFHLELLQVRGQAAPGARRRAAPRGSRCPARCDSRCPRARAAPGRCARAASERKAMSAAWAPASSCSKRGMPIAMATGKSHRGPERVAPADPVAETGRRCTREARRPPPRRCWRWRRSRGARRASRPRCGGDPVARGHGVGHGLLRGEGLRGHHDERGRWGRARAPHRRIRRRRCWRRSALRPAPVHSLGARRPRRERFDGQARPQRRSADAEREHVREALARWRLSSGRRAPPGRRRACARDCAGSRAARPRRRRSRARRHAVPCAARAGPR